MQPEAVVFARRSSAADDERRIREYLEAESAVSETSISLARKLGVDLQAARDVLEELADAGRLAAPHVPRHRVDVLPLSIAGRAVGAASSAAVIRRTPEDRYNPHAV